MEMEQNTQSNDCITSATKTDVTLRDKSHGYWSGRAEEYSKLHMGELESGKSEVFERLYEEYLSEYDTSASALDLGCGSGLMSILLAKRGYSIHSIDFSAEMLERAQANFAQLELESPEFAQMAAQDLTFADESFDIVVSRNVTWILEDVDKVYEHVFRVMRPGAIFLNFDANYGKMFREADAQGIVPRHKTQTLEQLRTRNAITNELAITDADRPLWDAGKFWELGASAVECRRLFNGMFLLVVRK